MKFFKVVFHDRNFHQFIAAPRVNDIPLINRKVKIVFDKLGVKNELKAMVLKGFFFVFSKFVIQGRGRSIVEKQYFIDNTPNTPGTGQIYITLFVDYVDFLSQILRVSTPNLFVNLTSFLNFKTIFLPFWNVQNFLKIGKTGAVQIFQNMCGGN